MTDNLQIHTMELVTEKLGQLPTLKEPLRRWMEFFHYSDKKSEAEMKFLLRNSSPEVGEAYGEYLRFNESEELRMLDEIREKYWHDYTSDVSGARREGEAKGNMEGRAKILLNILAKRFQAVPESLAARILAATDLAHLEKLADFALDCESLDAFSEML